MFPQNKFVRIQIMLNITPVSDYVVWVVSSSSNPVRFITSSYVSVRSLSIIASQVRQPFVSIIWAKFFFACRQSRHANTQIQTKIRANERWIYSIFSTPSWFFPDIYGRTNVIQKSIIFISHTPMYAHQFILLIANTRLCRHQDVCFLCQICL